MKAVLIKVNGEPREEPQGRTLEELVGAATRLTSGVAAAVNGQVVPRRRWAETELNDGDEVEVVTAVQGG
jgi:sulfur carrier protein